MTNPFLERIECISLAALFWQSESEGIDGLIDLERNHGFNAAEKQVNRYLSDRDFRSLCNLVLQPAQSVPEASANTP